ncbi:MAG TPA: xanthine dehydrogenase family protein subunit M [Terriglobia bacterium]|nr:xanthine dehydrogenase family protein subunit M [Terriglobia bacterium]
MEAFEYARPKSIQEAIKLLTGTEEGARALAGGTDLISLMKDGVSRPPRLVSLSHLNELKGISFRGESGLRLGAGVTLDELMENAEIRSHYPALVQAAEGVRSPQIRSMGTVGGDLCQRPRCWYYRAGYGLLATYKGKPLVPDGDNRYHAILGNSGPAYFVSPSSLAPILIALDAKARLHGPQGARELSVREFFITPKSNVESEHALKPGEIVTEILVPHPGDVNMAIYEVRQKEALDWPLAAAAVVLKLEGGTVQSARVVLGHVAPVPWPSPEAEEALKGKSVDEDVACEAGKAALSKATPLSRNAYKVQLARVAVKRAILRATA